jgi:hypothetical protein
MAGLESHDCGPTRLACCTPARDGPSRVYLPTDFSAAPLFSIPEPVPKAIFLAPHLIPRPVALTPWTVALPVAVPVFTTAVFADPPAVRMSCPAPSWPNAAGTGAIKQIDTKMFLAIRMVLL